MAQRIEGPEAGSDQVQLPAGVLLKPPVTAEDLRVDTECDPEGADEFVTLIRALRKEG
jgi:hypothetical protein